MSVNIICIKKTNFYGPDGKEAFDLTTLSIAVIQCQWLLSTIVEHWRKDTILKLRAVVATIQLKSENDTLRSIIIFKARNVFISSVSGTHMSSELDS